MRVIGILAGLSLLLAAQGALALPEDTAAALSDLSGLSAFSAVPAQPASVLFYPSEAQLSVSETLQPAELPGGGLGFVLSLPASVDRDTFSATLDEMPAAGFYWLEEEDVRVRDDGAFNPSDLPKLPFPQQQRLLDPAAEPSAERRAILERLLPLRRAVAEKSGAVAAIEARLRLLRENIKPAGSEVLDPAELAKMDELLNRILPELYVSYEAERRQLYNLRQRHDRVQAELEQHDAATRFAKLVIPYNGKAGSRVRVAYTYNVPSSFGMDYRLLAYPEKKSLTIEQDATLLQQSGFTWRDVEVLVSTAGRDRLLQPAIPRPWRIEESRDRPLVGLARKEQMAAGGAQMASPSLSNVAERDEEAGLYQAYVPRPEQRSTFKIWNLGRQTLDPARPVRLPVASDSYPADYYYTLRPSSYFRGFLTAELNLDRPLELALGQARYFVDDLAMGQNSFSFNGSKGTLFFGTDPQVTGIMNSLRRSSGEKGLISKEQTADWSWSIVLSNTRPYPVEVRVEDPAPEAMDESFKLEVKSTPKAELATTTLNQGGVKIYRWKLSLKPGEPFTITHEVRLSAPTDKKVSPGRGEI